MTKKEFILTNIAPYYHNPETCGYDKERQVCQYLTKDGRMCVAGKNLVTPEKWGQDINIVEVIEAGGQYVFNQNARNILTNEEWADLQYIHDSIAERDFPSKRGFECMNRLEITEAEIKATI